jgi:outer membrane lipoprotein SlyB
MRARAISITLLATVCMAGCAEYGGYRPTIDTYNDPNAQTLGRDDSDCRAMAKESSGGAAAQTATGGVVGGLIGAAAGAAIGAATGNPGKGAAIGAATGGVGGGAYKGITANEDYKVAYRTCMRSRGHSVVD